jgi:hypothetical protein
VLSPVPPVEPGASRILRPGWTSPASLRWRLQAVRRRRLVMRVRDWLGIAVISGFAVTLFVVTLFSLLGR